MGRNYKQNLEDTEVSQIALKYKTNMSGEPPIPDSISLYPAIQKTTQPSGERIVSAKVVRFCYCHCGCADGGTQVLCTI